jgi:hypothetical protein
MHHFVDRQLYIDQELTELKSALIETTANNGSSTAQQAAASDEIVHAVRTRLTAVTDTFYGQLQQLEAICRSIQVHDDVSCSQ